MSQAGGREALYEGRVTLHVVMACIVAANGGLLFGYDLGISGNHYWTTQIGIPLCLDSSILLIGSCKVAIMVPMVRFCRR